MLRRIKSYFKEENGKDWEMAYHQLRIKHENLCDYIKEYHRNESMALMDISDKMKDLSNEKAKLNKRMLNHEDNVSNFHVGICGWCQEEKNVTQPRDWRYPEYEKDCSRFPPNCS